MIIRFIILLLIPGACLAQKHVVTYYDAERKQLQEDYFVLPDNNDIINGAYKRYYENGNLQVEGKFEDGVRNGTFLEYSEGGKLLRKISYVNGMRHGPVEVYDEDGQFVQRAFYQNNLLVDSIRSFYEGGNVRMEGMFVKGKPDGIVKEYFPSGKVRKEITYKNKKAERGHKNVLRNRDSRNRSQLQRRYCQRFL